MAHLKRLVAPRSWPIQRKKTVFITRPYPRAKLEYSLPLSIILRDMLKTADTIREVRRILSEKNVLVNGVVRTNLRFAVTIMDILEIKKIGKYYRVTFDRLGRVKLEETDKPAYRLARVENKTKIKSGKIQLNLLDGTNVIADKEEYKTGDVVKLSIPDNKLTGKITPKEGANALVIGGAHRGESAKVKALELSKNPKEVILQNQGGEFRTRLNSIHLIE